MLSLTDALVAAGPSAVWRMQTKRLQFPRRLWIRLCDAPLVVYKDCLITKAEAVQTHNTHFHLGSSLALHEGMTTVASLERTIRRAFRKTPFATPAAAQ